MEDNFIFDFLSGFATNKKDLERDALTDYVNGRITKQQLDEKMSKFKNS